MKSPDNEGSSAMSMVYDAGGTVCRLSVKPKKFSSPIVVRNLVDRYITGVLEPQSTREVIIFSADSSRRFDTNNLRDITSTPQAKQAFLENLQQNLPAIGSISLAKRPEYH